MCARDHNDSFRRGNKSMVSDKTKDPLEDHFKTSMLFTKSIKTLYD